MNLLINLLTALLNSAKVLGLRDDDFESARELLNHYEFELCFDTIVTQVYEYNIDVDIEFYKLADIIGNKLSLPKENYSFIEELIRDSNKTKY